MNRNLLFTAVLVLAAPAAFAQQQPQRDPMQDMMRRQQESNQRQFDNNQREFVRGDHQAWLNSMANLTKLRAKLTEAWQGMGMSPQGAKLVADAYDPNLAARLHHASLRGKSDQDVAQMMQLALKEKRYLDANQLLIDYQREKLKLGSTASIDEAK